MKQARVFARPMAAILMATLLGVVIAISAGPASSASCQRWGAQPVNPGVESVLYGVDAFGPCSAYVVGYYVDSAGVRWSLMEHWDGSDWVVMPGATIEGGTLYDVLFTSSKTGWAVGSVAVPDSPDFGRLILRWNGSSWKQMGAGRGYDHVELRALSTLAQKGVWAVGRRYDPATEDDDAIALRWNGSSWGERPITLQPDTSFGDTRLYDVQAIESSYALAVGVDNNWPLFLRWNGKTWKEQVKPDSRAVPYSGLHVNSIRAADTDDAWAVGYSSPTSGPASTLILRWNGKKWRIFDSPNVGEYDNVLTAVKPGCCRMWAVGYYDVPDGAGGFRHQTLVLSWDDRHKVWEIQNSLNFSGSNQLFAIDGQVLSAWAVGSFGETSPQPMALACC